MGPDLEIITDAGEVRRVHAERVGGELLSPEDHPMMLMPIESDGTNGREWAEQGRRPPSLIFRTMEPITETSSEELQSSRIQGQSARIIIREFNDAIIFDDVIIVRVTTEGVTGRMFGRGNPNNLPRTLVQLWEFDL